MQQFNEKNNLAVFTCTHVMRQGEPILYVSHDENDGGWQFLCGKSGHKGDEAMIVALEEIIMFDESVTEVADIPEGIFVERKSIKDTWMTKPKSGKWG